MKQDLFQVSLLVIDYDEAINFYTKKLGFELVEDIQLSKNKRWVRVKPQGSSTSLLLAKAKNAEQLKFVGNQTGGRVFLFLYTDDIERDLLNFNKNQITIHRELSNEPYGRVLVFKDLYGNLWDLIQPKAKTH
ncbi:MAG: VOC family protein [Saprospiraceae bacterium]|nr:VOC family protein [Bacteroidia bacterium]NNE13388.1 VOC family protein [Saprospiraceae bacterium]NNL93662.1 VOC family protein [Saprospiraceae bacterium]